LCSKGKESENTYLGMHMSNVTLPDFA
jgi:hypothetical protein